VPSCSRCTAANRARRPPEGLELALEKAERFGPPSLELKYAAPGVLNRGIGWPAVETGLTAMFRRDAQNPVRLLAEHVQQPGPARRPGRYATLERLVETYKARDTRRTAARAPAARAGRGRHGLPFQNVERLARSVRLGHLSNVIKWDRVRLRLVSDGSVAVPA
jgi:hypothetical protein